MPQRQRAYLNQHQRILGIHVMLNIIANAFLGWCHFPINLILITLVVRFPSTLELGSPVTIKIIGWRRLFFKMLKILIDIRHSNVCALV